MYFLSLFVLDSSCCESLLELAREYDIKRITALVDEFLCHKVDCAFHVIKLADSFDLKDTLKKNVECYTNAINSNDINYFCDDWSVISDKTKLQVMSDKADKITIAECGYCPRAEYCNHTIGVPRNELKTLVYVLKTFGKRTRKFNYTVK